MGNQWINIFCTLFAPVNSCKRELSFSIKFWINYYRNYHNICPTVNTSRKKRSSRDTAPSFAWNKLKHGRPPWWRADNSVNYKFTICHLIIAIVAKKQPSLQSVCSGKHFASIHGGKQIKTTTNRHPGPSWLQIKMGDELLTSFRDESCNLILLFAGKFIIVQILCTSLGRWTWKFPFHPVQKLMQNSVECHGCQTIMEKKSQHAVNIENAY